MVLTKINWILIGLIVVFLGGNLIYLESTKLKSELASSQSEQPKSEPTRGLVIPSSLNSGEVMAQFVSYIPPWGEVIIENHIFWASELGIQHPHTGFVKGFSTSWHGVVWTKKDGTEVEPPQDPYGFILNLAVLKYKKPEFAKEDYDRVSVKGEFKESILKGIKLKTKIGLPSVLWNRLKNYPTKLKQEQCQQYLLHSGNFVIYGYGLKEVAEDVMLRVIEQYEVE